MENSENENIAERSLVKLLVVDDREDNLFSIETILENDYYQIVKATSGRAALKILLQHQDFTLILMDVQMPDMNGFETASLIYARERLRHIPIIFITAHDHSEDKMYEGYRMGGVDFIYKPINPELLRYKVSVFVELYQKTRELREHESRLLSANYRLEKEVEERKISEEKISLLNQQLVENNLQLKNTIDELDRFAYVASHDLQEPLRKILVFSDRIRTKYKDVIEEEVHRNLEKIVKASERMQSLISDLLRFSRQTNGAEDFTLIHLDELMSEVLADMEIDIEKTAAQINIAKLPVVWGIPSQMRQLFQNLVSNAIKFRKQDEVPLVHIYDDDAMTRPSIVVQDNGIGFDPKYSDDIFMVFKRLHSYHEFEGSGVGLSICKKIIEKHHASIRVESKPGAGSKFIVDFPPVEIKSKLSEALDKIKAV